MRRQSKLNLLNEKFSDMNFQSIFQIFSSRLLVIGILSITVSNFASTNLVLNKTTVPTSASVLVDGNLETSAEFGQAGSFYIDMGVSQTVARAVISGERGHNGTSGTELFISDDAINWKLIGNYPAQYIFLEIEVTFSPVTGRYLKVSYLGPVQEAPIREPEIAFYGPNTSTDNLAKGKPATVSTDTKYDGLPVNITDGDYKTGWIGTNFPCTITIDLGTANKIDRMRMLSDTHYMADNYSYEVSIDNIIWTPVAKKGLSGYHDVEFAPVDARYVRCIILSELLTDVGVPGAEVREFQVFGPGSASVTSIFQNAKGNVNANSNVYVLDKKQINSVAEKLIGQKIYSISGKNIPTKNKNLTSKIKSSIFHSNF